MYLREDFLLGCVLSACGQNKDIERSKRILKKAVELEPTNHEKYVVLRNLYPADSGW